MVKRKAATLYGFWVCWGSGSEAFPVLHKPTYIFNIFCVFVIFLILFDISDVFDVFDIFLCSSCFNTF